MKLLRLLPLFLLATPCPADDPLPPYKRVLDTAQGKRVGELQKQIDSRVAASKFTAAQQSAEELLRIRLAALGKDHWETVNAHFSVEGLKIIRKQPAAEQAAYAQLGKLQEEAEALKKKGLFAQAQPLLATILATRRHVLGEEHPNTADSQNDLAMNLDALGKLTEAQSAYEKALAIWRKVLGEEHPDTAACYNNLAVNLTSQRRFAEARELLEKALAIRLKVLGEAHAETAINYNNIGFNLDTQAKHTEARPYHDRALAIRRKVLGEEHADTADSYNNVAFNLHNQGKYAQAQPFYEQALAIYRKVLGEEHPRAALGYNNLALIWNARGKYAEAMPLFEKGLAIRRKVLGEEHPETAVSYNSVAFNLNAQGKFAEAQLLFEKALAIFRKTLSDEHPLTAGAYNNVAFSLHPQGKYAEARPFLEKALAICLTVWGEEHHDTASAYNNVAFNLNSQGKYVEARPLLEKALALRIKLLGEEHAQTAESYENVALNLIDQRKYAAAMPILEKALAIRRQALGEEHAVTSDSYNSIGFTLNSQGKYTDAQPFFEKALAIQRKSLGEEHPRTALSYRNLAINLYHQAKYAAAQPPFEKALATRRKLLGDEHPDTALTYHDLAFNLQAQGRTREAIPLWQTASGAFESARLHVAGTGFERALYRSESGSSHAALAAALAELHEPRQAWRHAEAYLARGLLDDLNPASRKALDTPIRLAKLNEELVLLLGRSDLSSDERERRDALRLQSASLHKALIQAAAERSAQLLWPFEKIQPAIPSDAALVFWLDVRKDHWACILRQTGEPRWQRLSGDSAGRAWTEDDHQLAQRTYDALTVANHPQRENLLAALRAQRLEPLLPHLEGIRQLLIIPTGDMAKIPLEALTDRFTVSYTPSASIYARLRQRHRSLEGRSLLALANPEFTQPARKVNAPPGQGLLLTAVVPQGNADTHGLKAGDILLSYNQKPLSTLDDLKPVSEGPYVPAEFWRDGTKNAIRLDPGRLAVMFDKRRPPQAYAAWQQAAYTQVAQRSDRFVSLPGTQVEVEALARLVPETKLLLGSAASEQTLEQLAESGQLKQYRLLHFATHGEVNEGIPTESALILAQDRIAHKLDDQLARTLSHKKPLDGRLTVGTILEKWDLDADLVVLSACETGLGTKAGGEGLLGFAQALLQKGARSVVLSRWKVDDTATTLLMIRFYQNLLGKRAGSEQMPKADALRESKQWLRNLSAEEAEKLAAGLPGDVRGGVRERGKPQVGTRSYANPYYWAAFILIGDPD